MSRPRYIHHEGPGAQLVSARVRVSPEGRLICRMTRSFSIFDMTPRFTVLHHFYCRRCWTEGEIEAAGGNPDELLDTARHIHAAFRRHCAGDVVLVGHEEKLFDFAPTA